MQKKRENYLVPPGPPGPPGQKVLGPVVLAGQDLETLKVLWSRGPGTKEVQKVPRTKNWKSPGTMETLMETLPIVGVLNNFGKRQMLENVHAPPDNISFQCVNRDAHFKVSLL